MEYISLLLKPEIEISIFDDGNETPSYLVSLSKYNWKVSQVAYFILSELSAETSYDEIIASIQRKHNVTVSPAEIVKVLEFVKKNSLDVGSENPPDPPKKNKYLWGRITIIPQSLVSKIKIFTFLFQKNIMFFLFLLSGAWLGCVLYMNSASELAGRIHQMSFTEVICCYLIIGIIGLFHELGHSSALIKYKENPGRIGVAVYFIMPVFFSDVTRAWRLKRSQRIVVDLGGIYLQILTMVILFIANELLIDSEIIEVAVLLSALEILSNLNPFIRLDGYWVLCDYLGVTNIMSVMRELLVAPFKKPINKSPEVKGMRMSKKIMIYIYMLAMTIFFLYFGKLILSSIEMAFHSFSYDISCVINGIPLMETLSIASVASYVSSRFSSLIVMIFVIRLMVLLIKNLVILIIKRREEILADKGV